MAFSTAMSRVRWMVQTVRKATITNDEIPYRKACMRVSDPFSLLYEPRAWNEPVRDSLTVPAAAALAAAPSRRHRCKGDGDDRGQLVAVGHVRHL